MPPASSHPSAPVISGGEVGAGLTWAWSAFTRNLGAFLVPALVYSAIVIEVIVVYVAISVAALMSAGPTVLAGHRAAIGESFVGSGATVAVALVLALVSSVLNQFAQGVSLAFYLVLIPLSLLMYFAAPEAAHRAGFAEAISSSVRLVTGNLGTVLLTALLSLVIALAMIIPLLALAVIPLLQLLVLGVHQRVTGNALHEPVGA